MTSSPKIMVGLSGGVDSAVTAFLLKEQGYHVSGCYMQNWVVENDDPYCSAERDLTDAKTVCDQLHIPFHCVNFSREYWDQVFQHCLDEFVAGRTPNPDIWCNQFIKFDVFLKHILQLGAEYLATGHYARKVGTQLHKAKDLHKDQSYFLYTLTQEKLSRVLFPLGEMTKPQIRQIAKKIGLSNAEKKDSTGICFIGERKFKTFLQDFILAKPGLIKTLDGDHIGKHDGLMFYTIGQRKGLHIGGTKNAKELPWYVVKKNISQNELVVAQGKHPMLFSQELFCEKLHWIAGVAPTHAYCSAKIRYRQTDQACHLTILENDTARVVFDKPQCAITPGQSIVFYDQDICLGGGIIQ